MIGRWTRGPVTVILVAGKLFLLTQAIEAYSGPEHTQISNLGLWIAYERLCRQAPAPVPACNAAQSLLACVQEDCGAPAQRLDLGSFTRAGDFFTGSARIVSDPDACRRQSTLACREDLIASCELPPATCAEEIVKESESSIHERQRWFEWPLRIAATHRNKNHFREFASEQYNALHIRAVQHARAGHPELALRTEGVALHFLQDLFAPGHLASARAAFSDAASGSLHDLFNWQGLPFRVVSSDFWCQLLDDLELNLKGAGDHTIRLSRPNVRGLTVDNRDLEDFRTAIGGCVGTDVGEPFDYRARGDGTLFDRDQITHDSRMHRLFLVLASAGSIQQVLRAEADDGEVLQICFQHQSARADKSSRMRQPDIDSFQAPGAVLTQARFHPVGHGPDLCQPSVEGSLAGYLTDSSREGEFRRLTDPFPRISVAEVAWSPIQWGESNGGSPSMPRWEIGWTLWGQFPDSEVVERDESDELVRVDGKPLRFTQESLEADSPLAWTLAVHYEKHEKFDVWGGGLLVSFQGNLGSTQWNWYGVVEPGYALYQNETRDAWRWRGGARAGLGYGILFFEVGAERGFALDLTGDGHREWRYFAGPRVRFPTSWVSKVFRR